MKFFPEFGSCWGCVTIGSSADAAGGGWRTTAVEQRGNCHTTHCQSKSTTTRRPVKPNPRGGATAHWQPKLNAISENSPLPEVMNRPVKAKSKSPARVAPPPNLREEEYWESSYDMALPAFSPTSVLF
ncbi:hypothetical protein ABFX02_08G111400 [Erythranthe guttata]